MNADNQGKRLAHIIIEEDLDLFDVWMRYCVFGGSASADEFATYVVGQTNLSEAQRDIAALAAQELVTKRHETEGRIHGHELPGDVHHRGDQGTR